MRWPRRAATPCGLRQLRRPHGAAWFIATLIATYFRLPTLFRFAADLLELGQHRLHVELFARLLRGVLRLLGRGLRRGHARPASPWRPDGPPGRDPSASTSPA